MKQSDANEAAAMMLFGAAGLGVVSFATVATGVPTIASPYSLTVVLPVMDFGIPTALLVWPVVFLVWSIHLFGKGSRIPLRSVALAIATWAATFGWIAFWWSDGLYYSGVRHVVTILLIALVVCAGHACIWVLQRKKATFGINFAFHWMLFAWISWGALPWLGEGI